MTRGGTRGRIARPRSYRFAASRISPRVQERRQGQKARQAAARETQRRKAAAAADNAGERRIQDVKQEARRLSSMKQETLTSGVISTPIEEATGLPLTRPRLSSARKVDHDNSNHKDRSPADIDRREAAWGAGVGARTPTSGPVHIASPAIRSFSRRSNRKLVRNAINFLCLAGGHLQEKKTRALEVREFVFCDGACERRVRCHASPTVESLAYHRHTVILCPIFQASTLHTTFVYLHSASVRYRVLKVKLIIRTISSQ